MIPKEKANEVITKCSALVSKRDGILLVDCNCQKSAKFIVRYKISKSGGVFNKCYCTLHKNKLIKEIETDSFAELLSIENI